MKITIIDMPVLDTTKDDLTSKLISDIVINLLSYVAHMERELIHKRQAEGIAQAKLRGVKFGRPKIKMPTNFNEVANLYLEGKITNIEAVKMLGITRATFFRYLTKPKSYIEYKQ